MVITAEHEIAAATPARHGDVDGHGGRARVRRAADAVRGGARNVNDMERVLSAVAGAALLGLALRRRNAGSPIAGLAGAMLLHRGATGHCPVYDAVGVSSVGPNHLVQQHGEAAVLDASKATKVVRSVTIDMPRADLYRFWRNLENLPRVMSHLESVTVLDGRRSRWRTKAPAGQHVEWEAEIINEVADSLVAWRSVNEATVPNAGSVHFSDAPAGRGTEVKVVLEYDPPAGALGRAVARVFHEDPDVQVREDLRRFKAMMEAGEVPTTEGQPACRDA